MAKFVCVANVSVTDAGGNAMTIRKGMVVEASSAQITAWGSANFRAAVSPGAGNVLVTYPIGGGTLSGGTAPGSPTRDTAGETAGASN